jgi:hypothetical protein
VCVSSCFPRLLVLVSYVGSCSVSHAIRTVVFCISCDPYTPIYDDGIHLQQRNVFGQAALERHGVEYCISIALRAKEKLSRMFA